jgi:Tfp pilus assembly protein PilF
MSLLLDALKKAEKAKDEAKRRVQGAEPVFSEDESSIHVRTRDELPDISSPLEIHSEDIPRGGQENPVPDAFYAAPASRSVTDIPEPAKQVMAEPAAPRRGGPTRTPETGTDPQAAQRAAAKVVFDAKFREPNPKLPFYITMGVLGLFAVGAVVYFWYQLRPPPPLVNLNAKPPAGEKKVDAADSPPPAAAATAAKAPTQAQAIPGLPMQPSASTSPASPESAAQKPSPAPSASTAQPSPRVEAPSKPALRRPASGARGSGASQAARAPADPSKLSVNRAGPEVNPKLDAGWRAYNRGDMQAARAHYDEMLREEPSNRDALLGMAAVEVRSNRPELAEAYYQKLLESNPRDPHAQAGLIALRGQIADPVQTESRVKTMLATDPEAQVLYFTLGNQYALQGRWPEAQQAYFKAFAADPENPDFAYNLAVSLDQVKQRKLALEYYRRAIALAQQRSSSFDQGLARNRVLELGR